MQIFSPSINHTFDVPDDITPDEMNGLMGSVEQQAQQRAGILGGIGEIGRMVQSLNTPHYPSVDPVAAMAMTPQALNQTLQRQADQVRQREVLAQREREATAQALQQEKDRRVRLQQLQLAAKNDEAEAKYRESQMAMQEKQFGLEQDKMKAEEKRLSAPKYTIDQETGLVWKEQGGVVTVEKNALGAQAVSERDARRRVGTGGGSAATTGNSWVDANGMTHTLTPGGVGVVTDQQGRWVGYESAKVDAPVSKRDRGDIILKIMADQGVDQREAMRIYASIYDDSSGIALPRSPEDQASRMKAAGYTVVDNRWVKKGAEGERATQDRVAPPNNAPVIPGAVVYSPRQKTSPSVGLADVFDMFGKDAGPTPEQTEAARIAAQNAAYIRAQEEAKARMVAQAGSVAQVNAENAAILQGAVPQFETISAAAPAQPKPKKGDRAVINGYPMVYGDNGWEDE